MDQSEAESVGFEVEPSGGSKVLSDGPHSPAMVHPAEQLEAQGSQT